MSTMNFFQDQDRAKKLTRWLIFYYILAVLFVIVGLNLILIFVLGQPVTDADGIQHYPLDVVVGGCAILTGIVSLIILGSAGIRSIQLRGLTGGQVAESLGGRLVASNTTDFKERQLLNIVEEMSIAAGIAMPEVYILDGEESINAFAAGWSTDSAAVAVTRGALTYFNRDELQGVIGHEFSHILNGDMTLDMKLVGMLFGLEILFLMGYFLFRISAEGGLHASSGDDKGAGIAIVLGLMGIGLCVLIIGGLGKVVANILRMAISRQKEYLADASAVQFTRNPEGIGHALMKIMQINSNASITNPNASACGHFFFAGLDETSLMDSHPPLNQRIKRILPNFDGTIPESIIRDLNDPFGMMAEEAANAQQTNANKQKMKKTMEILGNVGMMGLASQTKNISSNNQQLLNNQRLEVLIHDSYSVHGVIYAMLMDTRPEIQSIQWNILQQNQHQHMFNLVNSLLEQTNVLSCADKILIAELSITALRQMSAPQYEIFRANTVALTEADGRIDLFEFALRMMITGRLDISFHKRTQKTSYSKINSLKEEFRMVLGYLAWQGADCDEDAQNAFEKSVQQIGLILEVPAQSKCSLSSFATSLQKIQLASEDIRRQFCRAILACINYDGKITGREKELAYAIGATINMSSELRMSNAT